MRKSLILALILGTASVAAAQPARPYDYDRDHRDVYGDRYRDRSHLVDQWVTLDSRIANNTNRHIIKVYPGTGRLEKIRLRIDSGRVLVRQVAVEFQNGTWQKMRVDRWLRAGDVTELDLPGRHRAVQRVIVYTDPSRGGWRNRGQFSVHAARPVVVPQYGSRGYYRR